MPAEHVATHSGATISHYVLKEPLGQGNLTQTWRALDHRDDSEVALRIFSNWLGHAPETRQRLEEEVATLQRISHPALVPIACAEFHEGADPSFLATPFIKGASLMRWMATNGTVSAKSAIRFLSPVIDATAALHRHGVVHENIRPSNIVIDHEGTAHLTDSDLSRVLEKPEQPLPGSYEYMSPERLKGLQTTPASDVYSLGCIFYELLTGMPPFHGSAAEVVEQAWEDRPAPVRVRNPDIPEEIGDVLMRCLSKNPVERPKDAERLQAALGIDTLRMQSSSSDWKAPKWEVAPQTGTRSLFATFGLLAGALALAGWAGFWLAPSRSLDLERARELKRLKQLNWSEVKANQLPADCLGYQPCVDRRRAFLPQPR